MSATSVNIYFSQGFDSTRSTASKETVSIPVGSFWDDAKKKELLCVNVFLILEHKYDLSSCNPTLVNSTDNKIELQFDFVFDPAAPVPDGAKTTWYLQYHVAFDAAVVGAMNILTTVSETTKPEPNIIELPLTKRGTTTTVQH